MGSLAFEIYRVRRARDKVFENNRLFGEPAWDILLDLFVANSVGKMTDITGASIASGAPTTTALRWMKDLESADLVRREPDMTDKRRVALKLTNFGSELMRQALWHHI